MPSPLPLQRYAFARNIGGVNDCGTNTDIKPYEAEEAFNIRISPDGAITKRNGYYQLNTSSISTSAPVVGIYQYNRFSGNGDLVVMLASGSASGPGLYIKNTGTVTFTSIQASAGLVDGLPDFAVTSDKLIVAVNTSTQELLVWNGSATAVSGLNSASAPPANAVAEFKNHLICMDDPTSPGDWSFSHLGDPTQFRNSDFVDVDRPTVGGTEMYGVFYCFTTRRILRVSGYDRDSFVQETLADSVGAVSPRTIVNVTNRNLIVWQAPDGHFYEFDGINTRRISNRIEKWVDGTSSFFRMNNTHSVMKEFYGINYASDQRVGFLLRSEDDSQNKYIAWYWYDMRTPDPKTGEPVGAWTIDKYDRGFSSLASAVENGVEGLYAGDYDGHICKLETGNAEGDSSDSAGDGSAFVGRYRTGPFFGEAPETTKRWRRLFASISQTGNYVMTLNIYKNFGGTFSLSSQIALSTTGFSSVWGTAVWGTDKWGKAIAILKGIDLGTRSRAIAFEFSDNSKNPAWRLDRFEIHYQGLPGIRGTA